MSAVAAGGGLVVQAVTGFAVAIQRAATPRIPRPTSSAVVFEVLENKKGIFLYRTILDIEIPLY